MTVTYICQRCGAQKEIEEKEARRTASTTGDFFKDGLCPDHLSHNFHPAR